MSTNRRSSLIAPAAILAWHANSLTIIRGPSPKQSGEITSMARHTNSGFRQDRGAINDYLEHLTDL